MKTLILSLLAGLACQASARLGETPEQCKARYGEPIAPPDKEKQQLVYRKAGITLIIKFWKGTAQYLIIGKSERDVLDQPVAMTEAEQETIAKANAGGQALKKGSEGGILDRSWETEDGSRIAVYYTGENLLVISTREYALYQKQIGRAHV